MNNDKLAEIKKRDKDTFMFHKELIEQRKREDLLNHIKEQENDAEAVEQAKEE